MPLALSQQKSLADVTTFKINSFSVDLDLLEIHVAYSGLDGQSNVIVRDVITIEDPEFTQAIGEANAIAGADVYTALKTALYTRMQAATGETGVVS